MRKTLSGSVEEVMQQLADQISSHNDRINALSNKVAALESVVRGVSVHLISSECVTASDWNSLLDCFSDNMKKAASEHAGDEFVSEQLREIGAGIIELKVDEKNPAQFEVIPGGKKD